MAFNLTVTLDEATSTPRRKEYLIKRDDKIMFVFQVLLQPKYLDDYPPFFKFQPAYSIGLVPVISYGQGVRYVVFEQNPLVTIIHTDQIEQFISDTKFANEALQYVLENIVPEYEPKKLTHHP